MKPTENLIKKFKVETNSQKDKVLLDELLQAQANSKRTRQSTTPANIWRIAKLAIAAIVVVFLSCWLAVSHRDNPKQRNTNRQVVVVKSETPAELMTLSSLRIALRDGGTEAVEKQFNKAFKILGPRPNNLSANDL